MAYLLGSGARQQNAGAVARQTVPATTATEATQKTTKQAELSETAKLFGAAKLPAMNLESLAETAIRDRNPVTRRLAFAKLLEAMTPENASGIRSQLLALEAGDDMWRDFHYAWGAIDGPAAFALAAKSPEPDMPAAMAGWASANPQAALAMMENLPPELKGSRDQLLASLAEGLADNDPLAAADFAQRQAAAGYDKAGRLMEIAAGEHARSLGPAAASSWAENLPAGPVKGAAMARVAAEYVRQDPEAAAQWAQRFSTEDYAAGVVEQVGTRWAKENPIAAADWLQSLPASRGQASGLQGAFGDWEDRDPVAAGDYLFKMPKTPQRDSAISGFASGYAWQDHQTALAWANAIKEPALRETTLTKVGRAFYRRDPSGAQAWLPGSGLSVEAQKQVMTR
jgi:hypothetical protein